MLRYWRRDVLDEQRMHRLYEKFILEYYRCEFPQLKASPSQIAWQLDDDVRDTLPSMQTDIMLSHGEKTLIIDEILLPHHSAAMRRTYAPLREYVSNIHLR